ncbi:MAG: radical SAM protein [Candidatus Eisenbacteria bacterium]|nr:radical SAM protein [Candidatus Eisenbacteria bacterium]
MMLGLLARLPLYRSMRAWGLPRMLPANLTVSVTYRCNSRCLTCRVYTKRADELSADEFDRVFASLGRAPYWYTMSGGEPFLRPDLPDICESAFRRGRPGIINIPTNGFLSSRIPEMVSEIARRCAGAQVIVNLSLDEIGEAHDRIRGLPGSFEKAVETYRGLRKLAAPNLTVGVHTVVSVHNARRVPAVYDYVARELRPDSYITEIAEERVELETVGSAVTPPAGDYAAAVDFLTARLREQRAAGISRLTQAFRTRYYEMVKRHLASRGQEIPCYAGIASAQIAPDGDVWFCCVRAESVGNLREAGYDFRRIWFGERARALRAAVRRGECACPLANASYTNMLMHVPTLAGVAGEVAFGPRGSRRAPSARGAREGGSGSGGLS